MEMAARSLKRHNASYPATAKPETTVFFPAGVRFPFGDSPAKEELLG
jgi:hypothetical protein